MPDGVQPIYAIGGPSVAVALGFKVNATVVIPVLDDGTRAHWIVCQTMMSEGNSAWIRTGAVGDTMSAVGEGISMNKHYGNTVLDVPRGHTNVHFFGTSGPTTVIVTPLAERPWR